MTVLFSGLLSIFLICQPLLANIPPDEDKIFFHLHQTIRWAEIYHQKKCFVVKKYMEQHLSKIKYSQPRLIDSKFYMQYISARDLWLGLQKTNLLNVEKLRSELHNRAENLNVSHPSDWQAEFLGCT